MSVPQIDAADHQRNDEKNCEKVEDDQRLKIGPGVRFYRESHPTNQDSDLSLTQFP